MQAMAKIGPTPVRSACGANTASSTMLRTNMASVTSSTTAVLREPVPTAISSATAARLFMRPPRTAVQYSPLVLYKRSRT